MISAPGIGSGLNVNSIIQQLMAVEQQSLLALQKKQSQLDADLSAFGQLKSALTTFQTAMQSLSSTTALRAFTATSANDTIFTATAASSATASTYEVEVVRLAEHHKMSGDQFADTATFGGAAGDSISIQVGPNVADTITVDLSTAATLSQIRDTINNDVSNPGVTASIISGNGTNQKLVLTADNSGAASALTLSYGGAINAATFNLQTLNNIGGDTSLLDAEINVDGYNVTRSSNTIDDVIEGVTLNLKGAAVGTAYTLTIGRDTAAVATSVQTFADAFNAFRGTLNNLHEGQLEADSSLLSMDRRLVGIMNTPASGLSSGYSYLAEIGVSFLQDGTISVDDTALTNALNNDFSAVEELFATPNEGFADRLDTLAGGWLDIGGLIEIRTDGITSRQRTMEDQALALGRRLDLVEARYRAQFTQLDTLLGNLQVTSDFLARQLPLLAK